MGIKIGSGTPGQAQSEGDGSQYITGHLEVDGILYADGGINGSVSSFSGSLDGDVSGTQAATVVDTVGGATAANVAAATALANAATNINTANAIVKRNASGNFAAGTITAATVTGLSAPTSTSHATNKAYVDGLNTHLPAVRLATTEAIGSIPSSLITVDGVQTLEGDRVLIKNYVGIGLSTALNGVYAATASGTWARTGDQISTGSTVRVQEGTTNAHTEWIIEVDEEDNVDINSLYLAGSGISIGYSAVGTTIATSSIPQANVTNLVTDLASKEDVANKNEPDGYAGLDENGDITGVLIPRYDTASNINAIVLSAGELATTSDTYELRIGDGSTSGGRTVNGNTTYCIHVYAAGTPAANGTALVAGYTAAKALTPGGSAISATNRAKLFIHPGTYSLVGATSSLQLDTAYVDVCGAGIHAVSIVTDNTYAVEQNADNVTLSGVRFVHTGNTTGAIRFNAGAGGSYASTNSGIIHEDLYFDCGNTAYACVTFHASTTILAGTYRRITANTSKKFYGGNDFSGGVSATFEDCVQGSTGTGAAGGFCGGSASLTTFNVFSGIMRRCRNQAGHVGLTITGSLLYCELRNNGSNADCTRGGASGRFYYNKLQTSGTGYSIGSSGTVTISAAHNIFKANGIHTDNTNNIDTPYNVSDADWSG